MRLAECKLIKTSEGKLRLLPKWMIESECTPRRKPATRRSVKLEHWALHAPPRGPRERLTLVRTIEPNGQKKIKVVRVRTQGKPAGFLWEPK